MKSKDEMLINSKGWQAVYSLGMLAEMFYILRENYNDLISEIDSIQNLPEPQAFIKTFKNKNLSKMLFNFLSSTSALIDCCRNTLKNYKETDIYVNYVDKITIFKEDGCANFIKDFRNYTTHYTICIPYMLDNKEIVLDKDELLKYKKWKIVSKQFIKNFDGYIGLKAVCEEYFILIERFYKWLYYEFFKYHRNDFIETSKLIDETSNPQLVIFYNSIIYNQNIKLKY